jgi:hypothetical protein
MNIGEWARLVLGLSGIGMLAACGLNGSGGAPENFSSAIVLNDQTFEAEIPRRIERVEQRTEVVLEQLNLQIVPESPEITSTGKRYRAWDGTNIVHVELVNLTDGATRITVTALADPGDRFLLAAPVIVNSAVARDVITRIVQEV